MRYRSRILGDLGAHTPHQARRPTTTMPDTQAHAPQPAAGERAGERAPCTIRSRLYPPVAPGIAKTATRRAFCSRRSRADKFPIVSCAQSLNL